MDYNIWSYIWSYPILYIPHIYNKITHNLASLAYNFDSQSKYI